MKNDKKTKKLVAIVTNNDDDIYCFRKELVEGIKSAGYDVLISCPYGEKFELMQHIEYEYDNPIIDRRGTNIVADSKLFLHYLKLLKKYKPDIVLTYTVKPNIYCGMAAHICKIPVICNVTGFGSVLKMSRCVQKLIMAMFKLSFSKAKCVMFQNESNMKNALETGIVKRDYKLIPGSGVNTERFFKQPYPQGGNGIDGETVVFNYIGRILKDKGVEDYIEAAKRIKEKYPNTSFNMLGFIEETELHYVEDLKNLQEKNVVTFHGSQKDTRPFIRSSHAIIHPSTYGEGMSNVLLESASSGRPIISTDNPGCKETFVDNETGFQYKGGNVDELCEKIEMFLAMPNNERALMGEKGRTYIEKNFSREIVVNAYLQKINELV